VTSLQLLLVIVGAFVFLALGSFVCVIIDRLPVSLDEPNEYGDVWDTRPWSEVLGGTSRCSDCGADVRWTDNIPVLSWLVLRGRCRDCGARIPAYHPVVELLCPLLFLGAVWAIGIDDWRLLPLLWLIPAGLAISVIDLRTLIVPTRVVWPSFAVVVALSVLAAGLAGEWAWLLSALVGLVALAGPLFVVWFVFPSGMGFGDVRLTVLLGWSVGFFAGVRPVAAVLLAISCLVIASVVGLVVGVVALGARGRKAQVPFGPALIIAAYTCMLIAPEMLEPFGTYSMS
jgi:leader peptidase (prepilin peptidase)/N-methyltransferase